MISDTIHLSNQGAGIEDALHQAEAVAVYKSLSPKNSLYLRLLTEEMMGMMRALTEETEADFWIETEDNNFILHLKAETIMNSEKRERLLASSTSGKNEAAKGVIGKLIDLFQRTFEPSDGFADPVYDSGWLYTYAEPLDYTAASARIWSMNKYKESLGNYDSGNDKWDELEKSVVAKLSDEIKISIESDEVEMTVYKKME